jgi:hypothetical protein
MFTGDMERQRFMEALIDYHSMSEEEIMKRDYPDDDYTEKEKGGDNDSNNSWGDDKNEN